MNGARSRPGEACGLVVIGGGPAGHAAAVAYRDAAGTGPVLLVSADDHRPYQRPPLSKDYLRGETGEDELSLEPATFYRERDIEVRLDDAVVVLDLERATVTTRAGRTTRFHSCVVATGCEPARLPVPGADHPNVLRLRLLRHGRVLRQRAARARTAVVIGSGFIGCEAAASLAAIGIAVTIVSSEELPQLARLGRAAATRLHEWLTEAGVRLIGGVDVDSIQDGSTVITADQRHFSADLLLSAAGVTPRGALGEKAGLTTENGRIVVDERMASTDPRVFAAGDVSLAHNVAAGRRLTVEHWGEALQMGEIAGTNAAGGSARWERVPGFWSEIGGRTLKYHAWGDGFDRDEMEDHGENGFTVRYWRGNVLVGVLTHQRDDDYERAAELIAEAARTH